MATFTNHAPIRNAVPKKVPKPAPKRHVNIENIFGVTYRVTIASGEINSISYQRKFGTTGSGDKYIDEAQAQAKIVVYITINDMVEYYREGIGFYLTNVEDSKKIYEAVTDHTGYWRQALKYSMNMGDSPVDDLILMESFVATIYQHAKFEYEKRPDYNAAVGTLAHFLYSKPTLIGTTFKNDKLIESIVTDHSRDVKALEHTPDIDVFKKALMSTMGANHVNRN